MLKNLDDLSLIIENINQDKQILSPTIQSTMKNSMSYPGNKKRKTTPLHDQIQIKLAIADQAQLKSLVANCHPLVFFKENISDISAIIGVPVQYKQAADGVIYFEGPVCQSKDLSKSSKEEIAEFHLELYDRRFMNNTLSKGFNTSVITMNTGVKLSPDNIHPYLKEIGFSSAAITDILQMPRGELTDYSPDSWYEIQYSVNTHLGKESFTRLVQICDYCDRSLLIRYRDVVFPQCPVSFPKEQYKVLIEIKTEIQSFGEVIEQINRYRKHLGIQKVILICDTVTDSEAAGFHSQGISLYPATDLVQPEPA